MFKHILIPTDGSELSEKAVKAGLALAKEHGARVTGIHVFPKNFGVYYGELAWANGKLDMQLRETAQTGGNAYLDKIQAAAQAAGVEFKRMLVESDSPWESIVDTAQRQGADLIVMAAHGRRGFSSLLLGSETNKVLTHSKVPVLVYR